ncbi:MAG: biotin--[acetyl-CoA-carboxylase] ligase [Verrucomicrobiota bacterium]
MSGWQVHVHERVTSTNLVAAQLPVWNAVRADTQSAGRGRFQRSWISDRGGLWLSAVVPLAPRSPAAPMLPLAAGLAVSDALQAIGVKDLRMRWPNDLLVGRRKLAGLLVDQIVPGRAIVGIGINVANAPQEQDAALNGQVARLSDLVSPVPSLANLTERVLRALEAVWNEVERAGPEGLLPRINALWPMPIPVQLDLDGEMVTGEFAGVDARGRLRFHPALPAGVKYFEPHQVRLLREID